MECFDRSIFTDLEIIIGNRKRYTEKKVEVIYLLNTFIALVSIIWYRGISFFSLFLSSKCNFLRLLQLQLIGISCNEYQKFCHSFQIVDKNFCKPNQRKKSFLLTLDFNSIV